MARCRAEFLVEPFEEGTQGRHVTAAIEAARRSGLEPEVGPFGTTVEGDAGDVLAAVREAAQAAIDHGATRVSIRIDVDR